MNIVLCLSHSIEEYDQLKLLSELGYNVFSIGGYIDPAHPHDDKRPALPEVPLIAELKAAVDAIGAEDNLTQAQEHLPDAILEWADVIIYHHYLGRLHRQWPRVKDWLNGGRRRIVWRSVGQNAPGLEMRAQQFLADGLERVSYSPKEANLQGYAGHTAVIRFYKDPDEWCGWTGQERVIGNITQDMVNRGDACGLGFWLQATQGLPTQPAGSGSEALGGLGNLSYDRMRDYLRDIRCYLYTGTQPAPYTLGLIEAMMTGVPIVSIGPKAWATMIWDDGVFEGHELVENWSDDPTTCRAELSAYLADQKSARQDSALMRQRAIELFGKERIAAEWKAYLG